MLILSKYVNEPGTSRSLPERFMAWLIIEFDQGQPDQILLLRPKRPALYLLEAALIGRICQKSQYTIAWAGQTRLRKSPSQMKARSE